MNMLMLQQQQQQLYQQQLLIQQQLAQQQAALGMYATPLQQYPVYHPSGVMMMPATPVSVTATSALPSAATTATPSGPNGTESFEQKWDRIQAAKQKTNPFAEDIAKKYEIKL
jgi:hypothetical protein